MPLWARGQLGEEILRETPDLPWHITADEIEYDQENRTYVARGDVRIEKENRRFTADYIRFDNRNMTILARGNVVVATGEDILTGSLVEINLRTETGAIHDGSLFYAENHFYLRGDRVEKIGEETYVAHNATVTTCDGKVPAWKITGRRIKVTVEGYGYITHAAFWAKKVPVLYSPVLVFPAKRKRQSGFLIPQVGHSDRKGLEYAQPFFWAISENTDATLYDHFMEKRGHKWGFEYRYIRTPGSRGAVMYDYLDDRKVDDGTPAATAAWGYEADDSPRPNHSRYWFRAKHLEDLPAGFEGRLDLDIVSDQDYLHEFQDGYTGFDRTEDYFNAAFGRELDDYNDPVRVNRIGARRLRPLYTFDVEARWYDDVVARRWEETDTTVRKLPRVSLATLRQPLGDGPFYWQLDSEYTYFHREDGTRSHRADLHPRIFWPARFADHFTVEPSAGIRETAWYVDPDGGTKKADGVEDGALNRILYDLRLDLFTNLQRVYRPRWRSMEGVMHTLRPQVVYEYIEDQDQGDYPRFDDVDRIERANRITYGLTNLFTARRAMGKDDRDPPPAAGGKAGPAFVYDTFCRVDIEQSYYLDPVSETVLIDAGELGEKRRFSPIHAELRFTPHRFLSLSGDTDWDSYDGDFITRNVAVTVRDRRGDSLFAEHRFTRDLSESLYTHLDLRLSRAFRGDLLYERNLRDDEDIKRSVGLEYRAACWSVAARYTDEDDDTKYTLMVGLQGLGSVSTSR